jgi:four helix bundle protein
VEQKNIVLEKSFAFSLRIIKLSDLLVKERAFVLADPVLRSGTGIGSNMEEATAAVSRKEFIAKTAISYKEARETHLLVTTITR